MLQRALHYRENFSSKVIRILGSLKYLYYKYLDNFHQLPKDIDDLIDGILYCNIVSEERTESLRRSNK